MFRLPLQGEDHLPVAINLAGGYHQFYTIRISPPNSVYETKTNLCNGNLSVLARLFSSERFGIFFLCLCTQQSELEKQ